MRKPVDGSFVDLDGETFYRISNYDHMEDFFMTITSSCDVWNFLWSQGGITAGRVNSDYAIFPYYTADKVSDARLTTGHYAALRVEKDGKTSIWEPFAPLLSGTGSRFADEKEITRNIYKNTAGTKVWFEEINGDLGLSFRYGWTSSAAYGLVRMARVENLSGGKAEITVLDGARNIMPACTDAAFQNTSSVLLDAYKQTDLDEETGLAMFSLSSVVTDKAEPSEALLANVSWFTSRGDLYLSPQVIGEFFRSGGNAGDLTRASVLKGERASFFTAMSFTLEPGKEERWEQVFDTSLSHSRVAELRAFIRDREKARAALLDDIAAGERLMADYIREADGMQDTAATMTAVHHEANVMFNIMRGGFFADNGRINVPDLLAFIKSRSAGKYQAARDALGDLCGRNSIPMRQVSDAISAAGDRQLTRLAMEYMPIIFSRRHGDPSRPWNKFNIRLVDKDKNPILNYEGNWRDIFQNWEALAMSYPAYIPNMTGKFLNAMTADGFNPYRISREGIDWECPEPENPWAQYGYWGDHQVIYLQKFLELWSNADRRSFMENLGAVLYTSSNIPYRLKTYAQILEAPHSSLSFDQKLSDALMEKSRTYGSDAKLVMDRNGEPSLLSFTAKIMQIIIAKAANLVPGGGIWMNTQRPEWNDANNALAGWGLSVVTLCYLNRMLSFLIDTYSRAEQESFTVPVAVAKCFRDLAGLYADCDVRKAIDDDAERRRFTDRAGLIFEAEREELYARGYEGGETEVTREELTGALKSIHKMVTESIKANRREDGLYHTYNTMVVHDGGMRIARLQEMLEGQVAVLSSGLLDSGETLRLLDSLKRSPLYEPRQSSYILYPNKNLPAFLQKNNVSPKEVSAVEGLIERTGGSIMQKDRDGVWHFNAAFKNARIMSDQVMEAPETMRPTDKELSALCGIYEETFLHQNFTGRSGTFYAYEGLGSIYWHMVSKLLLAVQEHALTAYRTGDKNAPALKDAYYSVRAGLSFNKTPELYGAFPQDPYSHTPCGKGAKQPGMTGQVKEEVLTRWGELGVCIEDGRAGFNPLILDKAEFFSGGEKKGTLSFTWCGTPVTYSLGQERKICVRLSDGTVTEREGFSLTEEETKALFGRGGDILGINVQVTV